MSDFSDPNFYWGQTQENPKPPPPNKKPKKKEKKRHLKKDCIIKRIIKKFLRGKKG